MTASNFQNCLALELKEEGGFVNLASDPGHATNLGITQATLSHWLGRQATIDEVKALTPQTVAPVYHANFWNAIQGDQLPTGVDLIVFDTAINSGPGRAVKLLQHAIGATEDGILGPATLALVNSGDAIATITAFVAAHLAFYESLPTWSTFGHGWAARLHTVAQAGVDMVNAAKTA